MKLSDLSAISFHVVVVVVSFSPTHKGAHLQGIMNDDDDDDDDLSDKNVFSHLCVDSVRSHSFSVFDKHRDGLAPCICLKLSNRT